VMTMRLMLPPNEGDRPLISATSRLVFYRRCD
jgi:hypothetical protein